MSNTKIFKKVNIFGKTISIIHYFFFLGPYFINILGVFGRVYTLYNVVIRKGRNCTTKFALQTILLVYLHVLRIGTLY